MTYYLLFAWRNLWRNKRRTLLATASIFFAVILALFMRSMQLGSYGYMVQNSVSFSTGYLQVQHKGYWEDKSFDKSLVADDSLMKEIRHTKGVSTINPRIETVALIAHESETRIAPVVGVDPELEDAMTGLRKRIVAGAFLGDSSGGVVISEGLATRLDVRVGDSLIVFGQGYQGVTAADQLAVEGIVHFPIPKLDNALVFLALPAAQRLFNLPHRVTSISLMLEEPDAMSGVQSALLTRLDTSLTVMNWREMTPELVQAIEADSAGGVLILIILYVVIGFGVFGTVMMMAMERAREFGLLIALGMRRTRLILVTIIEAVFVSLIGALGGIVAGFPIMLYFYFHPIRFTGDFAKAYLAWGLEPIMPVSLAPTIFVSQTLVVLLIAATAALYPVLFVRKLKPVAALQGRGGAR